MEPEMSRIICACAVLNIAFLLAAFEASAGRVPPGAGCGSVTATFHDGSKPTRRPVVVPPAPGLEAQRVSPHVVRLKWSFRSLPAKCRPVKVLLSVVNEPPYTPWTERVPVRAKAGTHTIKLPDFIPPADYALASAEGSRGERSEVVRVRISP
jgi:hypothetical protein